MENQLQKIVNPLLAWYDTHRRALPWRIDRDPYHVWVSEIMLQQTRVEAVVKYYTRFIRTLPDVRSLSEVPEDRLLKLWEGLGYYSRARNLKKAAEMMVRDGGGVFPDTFDSLRKLPGVGEYTAGAIASICFHEKVTAVDGNVLRVVSRVTGSRENVLLPAVRKRMESLLLQVLPDDAGSFNEALMELGETVCLPGSAAQCGECPLRGNCTAFRDGIAAELPVRVKKTQRRQEQRTVFLLMTEDGRIAVEKRPDTGLLAGMYQLPNVEGFLTEEEIRVAAETWGMQVLDIAFLKEARHVFTHLDWLMKGYRVRVARPAGAFLWVTPAQLREQYALPTALKPFAPFPTAWKKRGRHSSGEQE